MLNSLALISTWEYSQVRPDHLMHRVPRESDGLNPGIQGECEAVILIRKLQREHNQGRVGSIWRSHMEMLSHSNCPSVWPFGHCDAALWCIAMPVIIEQAVPEFVIIVINTDAVGNVYRQ